MSATEPALIDEETHPARELIYNDFNIQIATVNGSGSQTANTVLLRSLFEMGIPVSGKNLFPSNIAGLPTWFTIRVSKDGYVARRENVDILVAMNRESAPEDATMLTPGSMVVYDEPLNLRSIRQDLFFYPVPFDSLVARVCADAKLRRLVKNMIYVGVLARLLGIEMGEVERSLRKQFKRKPRAVDLNLKAAQSGYEHATENLTKNDPFRVQRMDATRGKIIIDGNTAAAIGSMFAGVSVVSWYPITPSSSLCESLTEYLHRYRVDPQTGKATFAIVQAEDELAALGIAIGAGWAGARAMTSTSGPGISLMAEFAGLAYYAEVPVVIFDIQRVGPSTGLPTRTAQSDILSAAFLSHGDTRHVILLPASVEECFQLSMEAFDLAEDLQTPVFVMSDLDLGMNNWMASCFAYPQESLRRGKVLTGEELNQASEFARYLDVDGDGIPYRTLPGNPHPWAAYFTRGSGHNEKAQYSERPEEYTRNMDRLARKYETARGRVPGPVVDYNPGAEVGLVAFGSSHWALVEARDQLCSLHSVETSYLRLRAFPFSDEVERFLRAHNRVYVVEQNRDGQACDLIRLAIDPREVVKLRSVRHYDGLPITARAIVKQVMEQEALGEGVKSGR